MGLHQTRVLQIVVVLQQFVNIGKYGNGNAKRVASYYEWILGWILGGS